MYSIKTQIDFELAHRLFDVATYSERCRTSLHGHSYKVTVIIGAHELNKAGMVIDFKLLKEILRDRIEDVYDHCCIVKEDDPLSKSIKDFTKRYLIVKENPTAEWMAKIFFDIIKQALIEADITNAFVKEVQVQETEHNIAIYNED